MNQVVYHFCVSFIFLWTNVMHKLIGGSTSLLVHRYYFLFFERFLVTITSFYYCTPNIMMDLYRHMWGKMIPKRRKQNFPTKFTSQVMEMLASEEDHALNMYHIHMRDWTREGAPRSSSPWRIHQMREVILVLCLNYSSYILFSLYLMKMKYFLNIILFNEIILIIIVYYIFCRHWHIVQ